VPQDRPIPGSPQEWLARAHDDLALARAPLPLGGFYEDSASMPSRQRRKPSKRCIFIVAGPFAMYMTLRSSSQAFGKTACVSLRPWRTPWCSRAMHSRPGIPASPSQPARAALLAASGLQTEDFEAFARALDLSKCGRGSRFALEERVLATIADWRAVYKEPPHTKTPGFPALGECSLIGC
jgi:hypothetical protein